MDIGQLKRYVKQFDSIRDSTPAEKLKELSRSEFRNIRLGVACHRNADAGTLIYLYHKDPEDTQTKTFVVNNLLRRDSPTDSIH